MNPAKSITEAALTNKGRFKELLENIPVNVILNDRAALIGAAYCATMLKSCLELKTRPPAKPARHSPEALPMADGQCKAPWGTSGQVKIGLRPRFQPVGLTGRRVGSMPRIRHHGLFHKPQIENSLNYGFSMTIAFLPVDCKGKETFLLLTLVTPSSSIGASKLNTYIFLSPTILQFTHPHE